MAININATKTGQMQVPVFLKLKRPVRDSLGKFSYEIGPLNVEFNVKAGRLAFLNTDIKDISVDEKIVTKVLKFKLIIIQIYKFKKLIGWLNQKNQELL